MINQKVQAEIQARARAMGISMDDAQADKFAAYHQMLALKSARMNLTKIPMDDPAEAIDRHYLDSIAPLSIPGLFEGVRRLIDVGAGAGLPGIPLAIMLPGVRVVLLDSLKKRVGFLAEVIEELGLNAEAVHQRAEDAGHDPAFRERFDIATARAVAALAVLSEWTLPFIRPGGRLLAYKGPALEEELTQAQGALQKLGGGRARTMDMEIAGRDWNHKLLILDKARATPTTFPRKPAEIAKRPLA